MNHLLTHRLRAVLMEGPATIPEMHAEIEDQPLRRVQIAVWVLTSMGYAEACGYIPRDEGRGRGHNIYRLLPRGTLT